MDLGRFYIQIISYSNVMYFPIKDTHYPKIQPSAYLD